MAGVEQRCDRCGRVKWDGGHALNPKECDKPNGEVCRLWEVLNRYTQSFIKLREAADSYGAGNMTNIELFANVREAVARALDESIPAGSIFVGPGQDPVEKNRLIKERDAAEAALKAARRFIATKDNASELHVAVSEYDAVKTPRAALGQEIVHLLRAGFPVCRFSLQVPKDWPEGHKWAGSIAELKNLQPGQVPCGECVRADQRQKQRPA